MYLIITFLIVRHVAQLSAVQCKDIKVCKGESVILSCPVEIEYMNTFVRFNSKLVKEGLNQKYEYIQNGVLLVKNVSESDEGIYSYHCKYKSNCSRSQRCTIYLNISKKCEQMVVYGGSTIKMTCKTTLSDRIKEIEWFKSSTTKIRLNANTTKDQQNKIYPERLDISWDVLKIIDARKEDEGIYFCIITLDLQKNSSRTPRSHYKYILRIITSQREQNATARSYINQSTDERYPKTFPTISPTTTKSMTVPSFKTTTTTMGAYNNTVNNTIQETVTPSHVSCSSRVPELFMYVVSPILIRLM